MKHFFFALLLLAGRVYAQTTAETAWLSQQVTPILHLTPDPDATDLAPLAGLSGTARVVGLGECTHGSHEVFELKHRLLEYLVTQQGFTTFAIEADYGWGEILNEYIQTGQGDSLTVHSATGFEVWNTTEFWDMVEWMRSYNQQHSVKIRYVGVDMQDPYPNLFRLEQFARQRADTVLRRRVRDLRTRYFTLRSTQYQESAAAKQHLQHLTDELARHLPAMAAPAAMQQHAQVLVQRASLLQPNYRMQRDYYNPVRDQAMAANVAWVLQQEPAAKVVVWAHNGHIRRDERSQRMGYWLAQQLGPAYVALGFDTGSGTASVFEATGAFRTLPLLPPVPNSFEAWLDQAGVPNYLLLLRAHRGATTTPAGSWLAKSRLFRQIGASEPAPGPKSQFMWYPPLAEAFDALLYLHQTSASRSYRAAHARR